jgi:hypothetical protein
MRNGCSAVAGRDPRRSGLCGDSAVPGPLLRSFRGVGAGSDPPLSG